MECFRRGTVALVSILATACQAQAPLDGSVPNIIMAASGRRVAELEYDVLMLIRGDYAE